MRMLFVAAPLVGHVNPIVPFVRACAVAGHEVLVATGGDALAALPRDVPRVDVAGEFDFGRAARRLMLRHPLIARAELAGTAGTRAVSLLFGAINDALAERVAGVARSWRPEVIVHEPLAVAGAVAATELGVPSVVHGTSLFDDAELARVIGAALRRPVAPPSLVLRIAPASVVGDRASPMRPVPYSGEDELPAWLGEPGRRILVSRSTVGGPGGGDPMRAVVAAAADVDAEIVLVRPPERLTRRPLPDNVRTTGRIPLAPAIAAASAVVHHGGAGTVLDAMAAGIPQLVVPGPGDRRHNAELVADRGAGLAVPARKLTADHLRALLDDAGLAANAAELRDEIATMPEPATVVDPVTALAR